MVSPSHLRAFKFAANLALVVSTCAAAVASKSPAPPVVVDGHVHISNTALFTYPWANTSLPVACPAAPPGEYLPMAGAPEHPTASHARAVLPYVQLLLVGGHGSGWPSPRTLHTKEGLALVAP